MIDVIIAVNILEGAQEKREITGAEGTTGAHEGKVQSDPTGNRSIRSKP